MQFNNLENAWEGRDLLSGLSWLEAKSDTGAGLGCLCWSCSNHRNLWSCLVWKGEFERRGENGDQMWDLHSSFTFQLFHLGILDSFIKSYSASFVSACVCVCVLIRVNFRDYKLSVSFGEFQQKEDSICSASRPWETQGSIATMYTINDLNGIQKNQWQSRVRYLQLQQLYTWQSLVGELLLFHQWKNVNITLLINWHFLILLDIIKRGTERNPSDFLEFYYTNLCKVIDALWSLLCLILSWLQLRLICFPNWRDLLFIKLFQWIAILPLSAANDPTQIRQTSSELIYFIYFIYHSQ